MGGKKGAKKTRPIPASVQAVIEERRLKVAAHLLAGRTYRQIAPLVGVALGTVASDAKALFSEWRKEQAADIQNMVAIDLRRLDALLATVWDLAVGSPEKAIKPEAGAFDRVLEIIRERQAIMLGLQKQKGAMGVPTDAIPVKGYVLVSPDDWPAAEQSSNGKAKQ